MRITHLTLKDFRCFGQVADIPLHSLTVFIGENDAGKTAIVDSLERLLTAKNFEPNDVRRTEPPTTNYEIEGAFDLEPTDVVPDEWKSSENQLRFKKVFSRDSVTAFLFGKGFENPEHAAFGSLAADRQRAVLVGLGLTPGPNVGSREAQFEEALRDGAIARSAMWIPVPFAQVAQHLPSFERVASADYRQPDSVVSRVAQAVVDDALSPLLAETGQREPIASLAPVRDAINAALHGKSVEMLTTLKKHNNTISAVRIEPRIDFSKAVVSSSLLLDTGTGLSPVGTHGEGSKKKLWMGLLEWERASNAALSGRSILRAYDEPDVNLDYGAERQLFSGILEATQSAGSRTQAVVCTHAMTLVDRARKDSINLITVGTGGDRSIHYLDGGDDADVTAFLQTVGDAVGVSNSSLFYERVFLLVEGESEDSALPLLYRNLYGRSMMDDGLVLVNLHSCGAWKGILKVFLKNRAEVTVILMDQDCQSPQSSGYITPANLTQVGFPADFQQTSCFYVGAKEFEDAFSTSDIVATLNASWPKAETPPWTEAEIDGLKATSSKFSDELMVLVRRTCETSRRPDARKPAFAAKLAEHCRTAGQVPAAVKTFFERARQKANL